jgi:hypothetical protein
MIRRLLLIGLFFALLVPAEAVAAPPVLLTVGSVSGGHATATWSLPPGVQSRVIEVATSPTTGSDGYFFTENVKAFDTLQETQTSWTNTYQTDPGTYYVHVLGLDNPCFFANQCPVREASNVMVLTIGSSTPPPSPSPSLKSLTVSTIGTGSATGTVTSNPAGIVCAPTCSASFSAGGHVTLTATPASGSRVDHWSVASCGQSTSCEVVMDLSAFIVAYFSAAPTVVVTPTPVVTPVVTPTPPATNPVVPLTPPKVVNQAPRVGVVRRVLIAGRVAVQMKICHNESGPLRAELTRVGVGAITREFFLEKGGCAWYQVKTNWKSAGRLTVRARDADRAWSPKKTVA